MRNSFFLDPKHTEIPITVTLVLVTTWASQYKFSWCFLELDLREEGPLLVGGNAGKWQVWELQ